MRTSIALWAAVVAAGCLGSSSRGTETGQPIDLSSFAAIEPADADGSAGIPIDDVAYATSASSRRFYLTGIIGASFATLTTGGAVDLEGDRYPTDGSINQTLFTAGGAAGMAFDRENGMLRAEFEGRPRSEKPGRSSA